MSVIFHISQDLQEKSPSFLVLHGFRMLGESIDFLLFSVTILSSVHATHQIELLLLVVDSLFQQNTKKCHAKTEIYFELRKIS